MQSNEDIQIIIVEDNPEYRETVELILSTEAGMKVVKAFGNAEQSLRFIEETSSIDIVLLDLDLPGISGRDAIQWVEKYSPKTKVIILSQSDKEEDILHAIKMGAAGYLLKSATMNDITQGIRTVMDGGAILDPELAQFILSSMQMLLPTNKKVTKTESKVISKREVEVLTLISQGHCHKQVADELCIAKDTVADHLKKIYQKLDVPNAPAAVSAAYKKGIFE